MNFDPTRAIVTGSDSGIGRATAVALAAAGMDVGITWHGDERGAQDTADEVRGHGGRAVVAHLDAGDIEGCGDVIDALAADLGGVDVFVNNAGTGDNAAFLDLTLEQSRHTMAVDLDGAFVCLQRAARHMVRAGTGGRLIAITSVHEHQPRVGSSAYDAAKHGLGARRRHRRRRRRLHGRDAGALILNDAASIGVEDLTADMLLDIGTMASRAAAFVVARAGSNPPTFEQLRD